MNEELEKYAEEMTKRDTLLSAFRSLLRLPAHDLRENFLAKVRRFEDIAKVMPQNYAKTC